MCLVQAFAFSPYFSRHVDRSCFETCAAHHCARKKGFLRGFCKLSEQALA